MPPLGAMVPVPSGSTPSRMFVTAISPAERVTFPAKRPTGRPDGDSSSGSGLIRSVVPSRSRDRPGLTRQSLLRTCLMRIESARTVNFSVRESVVKQLTVVALMTALPGPSPTIVTA